MNDTKELESIVTTWLEADAPMRAPEWVLRASLARVAAADQARPLSGRLFGGATARFAWPRFAWPRWAGLAALFAATLIGVVSVAGSVVPTEAPPSAAPTSVHLTPRPSVLTLPGGLTPLEAGTYALAVLPRSRITLTLPEGWIGRLDRAVVKPSKPPAGDVQLSFWLIDDIYADPCHWEKGQLNPPIGPTVDDLATGLAGQPGRTTAPTDVTFAGFSGKFLELTVPADISGCTNRIYRGLISPIDGSDEVQIPGEHDRLWILDVRGSRLVIQAKDFHESSKVDRAELQQIVDSIRIEP